MSKPEPGPSAPQSRRALFAIASAAFSLPLLASLVNLLKYAEYPIAAQAVWPIYVALIGFGALVALVYVFVPRLLRILIEAAVVAVVVDINTEGATWIIAAAVAVLIVGLLARRPLVRPIAFGGAVLLAMCVIGLGDTAARPLRPMAPTTLNRPVLLHVVLDEHSGVAGLPTENPGTPQRREGLKAAYVEQGFRVYGAAYSQHMHTTLAVPQILNFGASLPVRDDNRDGGLAVHTAYLDRLKQLGYVARVYESTWLHLCGREPSVSCLRYDEAGLSSMLRARLPQADQTNIIASKLAARSVAVRWLMSRYGRHVVPAAARAGLSLPAPVLSDRILTSSLQSLDVMERLIADLGHARPGQAYVAHLLFPHYPYVTRADCRLKPRSEWRYRGYGATMREREDAAYEQMLCAARKIREATSAIERSAAGRNYIVVVHGDHGSRITTRDPRAGGKAPPDRDLIAAYATHFAIKGPGVAPGYVGTPARVDDLLAAFAVSGFTAAPTPARGTQEIFLEDDKWRPAERTHLPANWANP